MPAPMPMKAFAASDWWKWLWRSSVGWALLVLLTAAFSKNISLVIAAVGVIITGLADLFGRQNGRLWWAFVGVGIIFTAAGIYLGIRNYQLAAFFNGILKP
jgi:type IV secretory pathway VirB2 component (pilin)